MTRCIQRVRCAICRCNTFCTEELSCGAEYNSRIIAHQQVVARITTQSVATRTADKNVVVCVTTQDIVAAE